MEAKTLGFPSPSFGGFGFSFLFGGWIVGGFTYKRQPNISNITYRWQSHDFVDYWLF
jgi:hypothetical protein